MVTTPDGVFQWERSESGWTSQKAEWQKDDHFVVVTQSDGTVQRTDLAPYVRVDDMFTLLNGQGFVPMRKEGEATTKGFHYSYESTQAVESKIECSIEYKK
ncbi:MAG: hypothetical protein OHK005_20020 [Candidatus Methylacidiphilales bacterium]